MEMCLHCLYVSWLSLSRNSGSVEVWKCGNVEICLPCLHLVMLEVWKCGNMSSMSLSNNSRRVEMWKCGNMSSLLDKDNEDTFLHISTLPVLVAPAARPPRPAASLPPPARTAPLQKRSHSKTSPVNSHMLVLIKFRQFLNRAIVSRLKFYSLSKNRQMLQVSEREQ